jgi:hypothetical protein
VAGCEAAQVWAAGLIVVLQPWRDVLCTA